MRIYKNRVEVRCKDYLGVRDSAGGNRLELVGVDPRVVEVLNEVRHVLHQDVHSLELVGKDVVMVEVDYWSNTTTYYTTTYIFLLGDNIQLENIIENPEEYEEFKLWELYVAKINAAP